MCHIYVQVTLRKPIWGAGCSVGCDRWICTIDCVAAACANDGFIVHAGINRIVQSIDFVCDTNKIMIVQLLSQ